MRVLLVAINAKYIHSNLAVYSLRAAASEYGAQIGLSEFTVNQQTDLIFGEIYRRRPDLLLFSCYLWNRRMVTEVADSIRKVLPGIVIWAGGPEVSWGAEQFLEENPAFDGVMVGEGERTFCRLLRYYVDGEGVLEEIAGIAWRGSGGAERMRGDGRGANPLPGTAKDRRIRCNPRQAAEASLDGLPFVYGDLAPFENRILYYESSRGCPFFCSYCLSSLERGVRLRSLELVRRELAFFLEQKVRQVKFVDRTFNCNHRHALAIWRFLAEHDNGVTNFHFEISADLLMEEELNLLAQLRPGLVQLEIGVQTVNEAALAAIRRTAPFEKIARNVRRISQAGNIRQHLDLIAGLPYEGYESFGRSFDEVYRLRPQELQLGFLKVLRGSELYRRAEEYGIVYRSAPPYEVLCTRWISCGELLRLKEIEEMLEVYYNSHQFDCTVEALEKEYGRPFALYEALAEWNRAQGGEDRQYTRAQRMELLRDFARGTLERRGAAEEELARFDRLLLTDLYLRENAKTRPAWAQSQEPWRERIAAFYKEEERGYGRLPDYRGRTWKQMMKMTHLERLDGEEWLLFDYARRNPLNYAAAVQQVRLPGGEA